MTDPLDDAFGAMAYMAFLNDANEQTADELAAALADQHPTLLSFEELSREFRGHAAEIRLLNEIDAQTAVDLLNRIIARNKADGAP